jgi:hypothetical protein
MKRTITIEADDYDWPVNLQAVQKTAATWNGQAVELTLKLCWLVDTKFSARQCHSHRQRNFLIN